MRSKGFTVSSIGEEVDANVASGTVIAHSPPPGSGGIGTDIEVLTAARQTRPCAAGDLALNYQGNGPSEGSDFGEIMLRGRGPTPCELTGPNTVAGAAFMGARMVCQCRQASVVV